ncbi:fluoride efflux transporter FluC, partial [Halolamina salina]
GFLSSFTTYSTFAVESATAGSHALLIGNVVATYVLGFAAAGVGLALGRRIVDRADGGETA